MVLELLVCHKVLEVLYHPRGLEVHKGLDTLVYQQLLADLYFLQRREFDVRTGRWQGHPELLNPASLFASDLVPQ